MKALLHLYAEPSSLALALDELVTWIQGLLPRLRIDLRPPFLTGYLEALSPKEQEAALDCLAVGWAQARVRNPARPFVVAEPLYGEVAYERRRLTNPQSRAFGVLYDGEFVQLLLRDLIDKAEANLGHIHVIFTNQLLGTFDEDDRRYHARVSLYGSPNIISTNGLVESPAKPREYYLLKQQYAALGMGDAAAILEAEFEGRVVAPDDPRLTEIVKGYLMQSIFYHLTGDPFCPDAHCRLFNAHWQEEVIRAQLGGSYQFCPAHQAILEGWR